MTQQLRKKPYIYVIGHGGHGKTSVCEIIKKQFNLSYCESSRFAAPIVYEQLREKGITYRTLQECYDDRRNHRKDWHDIIREYNNPLTRLAEGIFNRNNIYCGLRNREEFEALKSAGMVDIVLWVDAKDRVSLEPKTSMQLTREDATCVIYNNINETWLPTNVRTSFTHGLVDWIKRA